MTITGYTNNTYSKKYETPYVVMINPETIKWNRSVEYSKHKAPDANGSSQKFNTTNGDDLSFDIIIDCTGVVDSSRLDMSAEISKLEKIAHRYNGSIHRPNFVVVQWGKDLIFKGVLKSMDTTYTLFRPNGSALRAKISLSFGQYVAPSVANRKKAKSSPDMTHLVEVKEGDTLPGLCDTVWNDTSHYVKVARFNKLNKFRNLKGGSQLLFPPIIQPE